MSYELLSVRNSQNEFSASEAAGNSYNKVETGLSTIPMYSPS